MDEVGTALGHMTANLTEWSHGTPPWSAWGRSAARAPDWAVELARLGRFDFAFFDGGHDLDQAPHDSLGAYAALELGGWLVWHDVGHPLPRVRVGEAIERPAFAEPVEHVEGTMVAFLREGEGVGAAGDGPPRLVWVEDFDGLHSTGRIN